MTREEAIICKVFLEDECKDKRCNEYKLLMDLVEAQPCEDAVSRQAVLDVIYNPLNIRLEKIIGQLPSVTPKQRTGHWVEIGDEPYDTWECDNCGFVIDGSGCVEPVEYRDVYKYCPNCGAKMEGVSE